MYSGAEQSSAEIKCSMGIRGMIEYRFTFHNISYPHSDSFNYQTEELVMDRSIIVGKCCYRHC